ncbi:DUF4397 domain-containing protein [Shewanella colwelliana]|uniref:DUF4397 domain-containing protein n=1 Tax=Shewanella colwelliana TaxID=23 RepID=UPI003D01C62E
MKFKTAFALTSLSLLIPVLSACGSDEDTSDSATYIQYYNGSPNSVATALILDDYEYARVNFADSLPRYSYTTGNSDLQVTGVDELGEDMILHELSVSLSDGDNHLYMLVGDYDASELIDISYRREEMDELNSDIDNDYSKMQVVVINAAMDTQTFDVYLGKEGEAITAATLIDSLGYKAFSTEQMFDTGEYRLYLTAAGQTEVLFETSTLDLTTNTVYKLVIRNSFGPGEPKITIDNVDSTGTPIAFANINANAEFRVFNGLSNLQAIDVTLTSPGASINLTQLPVNTLSAFESIDFSDYGVSVTQTADEQLLANNLLVTFNQDESKTLVIFDTQEGETKGMTLTHDLRPSPFYHTVNFANLVDKYDRLDVYFVRSNETIETAEYKLSYVEFTELVSIELPSDDYDISVVHSDSNGTLTLLYQSDAVSINKSGDYTMLLTNDMTQPLGYRVTSFQ